MALDILQREPDYLIPLTMERLVPIIREFELKNPKRNINFRSR